MNIHFTQKYGSTRNLNQTDKSNTGVCFKPFTCKDHTWTLLSNEELKRKPPKQKEQAEIRLSSLLQDKNTNNNLQESLSYISFMEKDEYVNYLLLTLL